MQLDTGALRDWDRLLPPAAAATVMMPIRNNNTGNYILKKNIF